MKGPFLKIERHGQDSMRIVTWNINGLRACLKRRFDGKLINLLQFLEAGEIINLIYLLMLCRGACMYCYPANQFLGKSMDLTS